MDQACCQKPDSLVVKNKIQPDNLQNIFNPKIFPGFYRAERRVTEGFIDVFLSEKIVRKCCQFLKISFSIYQSYFLKFFINIFIHIRGNFPISTVLVNCNISMVEQTYR